MRRLSDHPAAESGLRAGRLGRAVFTTIPALVVGMSGPPKWAADPDGDIWIVRRCWTAWLPRYRARALPAPRALWMAGTPEPRRAVAGVTFSAIRIGRFVLLSAVFLGEWALCLLLFPLSLGVRHLARRGWPVYAERLGRSPRVWKARLPDARSAARAAAYALEDVRHVGEPDRLRPYVPGEDRGIRRRVSADSFADESRTGDRGDSTRSGGSR